MLLDLFLDRGRRRAAVLSLAAAAALGAAAPAAGAAPPDARAGAAAAPKRTTLRVPLPSAGDISYGVVQVRTAGRRRAPAVPARSRVFRGTVGGLSIAARSSAWSKLRSTTRVHVIATSVAGGGSKARNVAFFVTRKKTGPRTPARGTVDVSIANGRADVGSFWVRGVDRRGVADAYTVRNGLATATANWARYLGALRAARALEAAANPVDVNGTFTATAAQDAAPGRIWTGGSKMTPLRRQAFGLIFGTMDDRLGYQAAKRSPIAARFIAKELGNAKLAARWRAIVAVLPLAVPDQYAAAAKEEARFAAVKPARISQKQVVIDDSINGADRANREVGVDGKAVQAPSEMVQIKMLGAAGGRVRSHDYAISCGDDCFQEYVSGTPVALEATTAPGVVFTGWSGCDRPAGALCSFEVKSTKPEVRRVITASFAAAPAPGARLPSLTVKTSGSGAGQVTSEPSGISCPTTCVKPFTPTAKVVLTAKPASGSELTKWAGCEDHTATTCTVTMNADRRVEATFDAVSGAGPRHWAFANVIDGFARPGNGMAGGPQGVSVSHGTVFVADTANDQVKQFLPEGTLLNTFGSSGADAGELSVPRQAAVDPATGAIYVSDTFNHRVQQWTASGQYVRTFPHAFTVARGIAVSPKTGVVAVADADADEVLQFVVTDSGAELAHTIGAGADTDYALETPEGLAFAPDGTLWVADAGAGKVGAFDDAGKLKTAWSGPEVQGPLGIAADAFGNVVLANYDASTVDVFTTDGVHRERIAGPGSQPGQVSHPTGAAIDHHSGDLYVADERNNRVQRFALAP